MHNIISILNLTYCETRHKICSKRSVTFLILLAFLIFVYISPLKAVSKDAGYRISPWVFPHLMSHLYFLFTFILGIIYFYSNAPFLNHAGMYQMIRSGRYRWCISQIISIIFSGFTLAAAALLLSAIILAPRVFLTSEWGKLLHTLSLTDLGASYNFSFAISYNLINKLQPIPAMLLAWGVCGLTISFTGIFLFFFSVFINRTAAISITMVLLTGVVIVENFLPKIQERLYYFLPLAWMQITRIGETRFGYGTIPPLHYSIPALCILIILMSILILIRFKYIELKWNKEE